MTRNTWLRPLRGGTYSSTSSVNKTSAIRSLFLIAENASSAPTWASRRSLGAAPGPEVGRAGHVDDQGDGQLALFDELFDEQPVVLVSGRNVPVDVPDVVARRVRTDFGKGHALTFEDRMVPAGELGVDRPPRRNLDATDGLENLFVSVLLHRRSSLSPPAAGFRRVGQGIGTASKMRCTTSSTFTFSASAS